MKIADFRLKIEDLRLVLRRPLRRRSSRVHSAICNLHSSIFIALLTFVLLATAAVPARGDVL
ncbi:MAG: hypothetical protein WCC59_06385, partial [Terriglobales bacterium]